MDIIDHVIGVTLAYAAGTTSSPDQATTVLNVLSKDRAPTVLGAVLSRGFLEFDPSLAIKHGHGLALLPHYPSYITFDGILNLLSAAGACGDMVTINLLWQLAGPATPARLSWYEDYGFISWAIIHGHVHVLDWIADKARAEGIPVNWSCHMWMQAAEAGHTNTLNWGIVRGHVKEIKLCQALLSARKGDMSVVDWWIASQPSNEEALTTLKTTRALEVLTTNDTIVILDWWWSYTGSNLPEPTSMAAIADAVLTGRSYTIIAWWWARFLEHRSPEHSFGTVLPVGRFCKVEILDWHCLQYHGLPEYFTHSSDQGEAVLGWRPTMYFSTSLSVMERALEQCAMVDGQKLTLANGFAIGCAHGGFTNVLDFVLRSTDLVVVEWSSNIVIHAMQRGQSAALEWWERHQDQLPEQNLDCGKYLSNSAQSDAVDVLT
ncbi:hypothetical protein BC828DRAFT_427879 [Blastocladiella britannica]|nr:hypothetical protein BC828DRAFT_427879 [Blastocladiella britannica]